MSEPAAIKLSVLDVAPVWRGSSQAQALRDTLQLAPKVEGLGYHRYWVAEHHNTLSIASSSPPVLAAEIANATSTMRVGSGGVLLPNHPTLVVAEQFGMLEVLHPGRIDLGLGRAPGTDPLTALVLRRPTGGGGDFRRQIAELEGYFSENGGDGDPQAQVVAVPAPGHRPDMWVLGSSPASAALAAELGMPYAFAHHIAPQNAVRSLNLYRDEFRPSAHLERPYAIVASSVIVADTEERARRLAGPLAVTSLQLRTTGTAGPMLPPEEAAVYPFTPLERQVIGEGAGRHLVGAPETVGRAVHDLLASTRADELMALTTVHDPADRLRSYELLTELVPLAAPSLAGGAEE
ncbi:LLM class flavin-dependent oxidoreductase [Actinomadura graeca]|uniref:LLM class flavin-dependent oxidoreductase n=1 Tax=Actinomadura graeca TaxID=2750812 RepID=A0ABX8QYR0_9ACTN|nr:LLM class flavin-dependent oxidoreductase [Actinomadura graeca]QXJ23882.1 LLM class flavin-dependent oxidoreductase [Actinomadura graeca]